MLTPTDAELNLLGRDANSILRELCNIERRVVSSRDQFGNQTTEWTTVRNNVKCNKAPARTGTGALGSEGEINGRIWVRGAWLMTFPLGTDVKTSDRIVIDGSALYVDTVLAPRSYAVTIRTVCVENE